LVKAEKVWLKTILKRSFFLNERVDKNFEIVFGLFHELYGDFLGRNKARKYLSGQRVISASMHLRHLRTRTTYLPFFAQNLSNFTLRV
jgi:hypothetical protein